MSAALLSIESDLLVEPQRLILALGQTINIGSSRLAHCQIPDIALKPVHLRCSLTRGGVFVETMDDRDTFELDARSQSRARVANTAIIEIGSLTIRIENYPSPNPSNVSQEAPPTTLQDSTDDLVTDEVIDFDEINGVGGNDTAMVDDLAVFGNESDHFNLLKSDSTLGDDVGSPDVVIAQEPTDEFLRPVTLTNDSVVLPLTEFSELDQESLEEQSTENSIAESPRDHALILDVQDRLQESKKPAPTTISWSHFRGEFWDYRVDAASLAKLPWLIGSKKCRLIATQRVESSLMSVVHSSSGFHIYQVESFDLALGEMEHDNFLLIVSKLDDQEFTETFSKMKTTFQSPFSFFTKMTYASDSVANTRMQHLTTIVVPRDLGLYSVLTRLRPEEFVALGGQHGLAIVEKR